MDHFRRRIAKRLAIGGVAIACVVGILVFLFEVEQIDRDIVRFAVAEAELFAVRADRIDDDASFQKQTLTRELHLFLDERLDAPDGRFMLVELYDGEGAQLGEAVQPGAEWLEAHLDRTPHGLPDGRPWYRKFLIDGHLYLQTIIPIDVQARHLGYLEGVYRISDARFAQIVRTVATIVFGAMVIVAFTALLLYPIIVSLQKGLIRSSEELRTANVALAEARDRAEAASRAKSEFLANMNHELRTPLNAIIGFAEVLGGGMVGPVNDKQRDYAEEIGASGRRLLGVINAVLDMARLEAGRYRLEEQPVDPAAVVSSVVSANAAQAREKGVEIATDNDLDRELRLMGEQRAIEQVIGNLVSNAVKHTGGGGRVVVHLRREESGDLVVAVIDNGEGIAPEKLDAILEPFQQADMRLSRRHEGTGLGLSISRRFMELHGGALVLESRVGRGTTAQVRFPAERVLLPAPISA